MDTKLVYAAIVLAVAAIAMSIYAVQKPTTAAVMVKANFYNNATVDYPGWWTVPLGWVYVDKDVILYINVTAVGGQVYSLYIDGVEYGNPATAWLTAGNHTVVAAIYAPGVTNIRVEYRVGT